MRSLKSNNNKKEKKKEKKKKKEKYGMGLGRFDRLCLNPPPST